MWAAADCTQEHLPERVGLLQIIALGNIVTELVAGGRQRPLTVADLAPMTGESQRSRSGSGATSTVVIPVLCGTTRLRARSSP